MKKSIMLLTAAFVACGFAASAQTDPVLLKVAGENITKSEFERVYFKNNSKETGNDEKAVREYLELYINYKLKVKEAESLKMDTIQTFVDELSGYKKQLAQPYLTDKNVTDDLIKEAYERMKSDVNASHILIKCAPDALPKDTLAAYNKAIKIRDKIVKGASFQTMARDSSDDPSAKENGGDLGYFTAMQMVYPFETAAFSTKPGQMSMPVRTRFGYHIIKTNDIRPAVGEIRVAHIMIKSSATDPDSAKDNAKKKIDEIYLKVKAGEKFEDLVNQYSEDRGSQKGGGALPWFGTGRMVPEFEKAAFALKNDNDYTEPVKTSYGWHIIKRLEKKGIPTFEDKKGELKNNVMRDSRSEMSKTALVNRVKKEYMFKEVAKNKDEFIKTLDSSLVNGTYNDSLAAKFTKPLFSIGDKTYTQKDFATFLMNNQQKKTTGNAQQIAYSQYDNFVNESCISYEESQLDKKYPEFKALMQEYRDGILLFDLTDKMVWSKAVKDSAGLQEFYNKNKNNYMWGERIDAVVYTCANADIASKVRKMLKKSKSDNDISGEINKESTLNLTIKSGKFSKGDNEFADEVAWNVGTSTDINKNNQITFVRIKEKLAPSPKSLDEARGLVTADYQSHLEKTWIEELRGKYPVEVNQETLTTVYKK
ncbi:MAG TPA: peptidylprolyl isomerase [Bacteroidia bacterium]|nr:peptidylprolyl isomerase [Bacteroidia bacterium]HNU34105.1 peptidylprolyl isomerase [Bacteroidia bacterium]